MLTNGFVRFGRCSEDTARVGGIVRIIFAARALDYIPRSGIRFVRGWLEWSRFPNFNYSNAVRFQFHREVLRVIQRSAYRRDRIRAIERRGITQSGANGVQLNDRLLGH